MYSWSGAQHDFAIKYLYKNHDSFEAIRREFRHFNVWRHDFVPSAHATYIFIHTIFRYTNREQTDMVFTYGQSHGNGRAAARLYRENYPHRQHPQHTTFARIFRRLGETGSFTGLGHHEGRVRSDTYPNLGEDVINAAEQDRRISTRQVARQCGDLLPRDFPLLERICRWFLGQVTRIRNFLSSILFTDEITFTRGGIINLNNNHVWDMQNPRAMMEVNHQH
ncbi:hypothetical protein ANN_13071 [Periplaneta americana]|uniref:DUF4817 domain-containing protein n=1 Tax=Periplaneta americana TaxID=6978 RepID=A0ABQ8TKL0_PERAM|nr:hypothetical protein ANN_13071 [Periplaneta americana]